MFSKYILEPIKATPGKAFSSAKAASGYLATTILGYVPESIKAIPGYVANTPEYIATVPWYITLLNSFKKFELSEETKKIELEACKTLQSRKFNELSKSYFKEFNARKTLLSNFNLKLKNITAIKKLLEEINTQEIRFADFGINEAQDIGAIQTFIDKINSIETPPDLVLKPEDNILIIEFLKKVDAKKAPFTKFELEPDNITQILKEKEIDTETISFTDFGITQAKDIDVIETFITEIKSRETPCFVLEPADNVLIVEFLKKIDAKKAPFAEFELEPDNITQIKKFLNALYYTRLTFIDLEQFKFHGIDDIRSNVKRLLWDKIVHEAYQACYLFTHLDVDLKELFHEEIELLSLVVNDVQTFIKTFDDEVKSSTEPGNTTHPESVIETLTDEPPSYDVKPLATMFNSIQTFIDSQFAKDIQTYPLSYKVGEASGTTIDQMHLGRTDTDYKLLTRFSADLPGYIDKFTRYIRTYTPEFIENEPALQHEKILELRKAASELLNDLENLKGGSFFVSLKYLKYIHILGNIITLSMSALEQIGYFNESTQDLICENISQLKYNLLPELFGLVDKIEDNVMLSPGTLSQPLMDKIKPFYETLIYYAAKPVDFEKKGKELRTIEDSRFLALRLERTYNRIEASGKALFKVAKTQEAFNQFFAIIEHTDNTNRAIYQLPGEVKKQLLNYYKLIKPYVTQINFDLNKQIINDLKQPEVAPSYLAGAKQWYNGTPIRKVIDQKAAIQTLITKKQATHKFHNNLSNDLIESVSRQTDLVLFPHHETNNIFTIDESVVLQIDDDESAALQNDNDESAALQNDAPKETPVFQLKDNNNLLTNPECLNAEQALDLYQCYKNKRNKLKVARNAYDELVKKLQIPDGQTVGKLSTADQTLCRGLYNLFQPYFIHGAPEDKRKDVIEFDKYLVHLFSEKNLNPIFPEISIFKDLDEEKGNKTDLRLGEHYQVSLTQIDSAWKRKSKAYQKLADKKFASENETAALDHDPGIDAARGYHLIQHTNYSKGINKFRTKLNEVIQIFNKTIQAELKPQLTEVPFPELKDTNLTYGQSKQVLAIKQLFNVLYHLEGTVDCIEQLDNRSSESIYVIHILRAYGNLYTIYNLTQALAEDPHFKLISRELVEEAHSLLATIQEHSIPYQASPDDVPDNTKIEYNGLWYTLNSFYIIPKHIRSLKNNTSMTTTELNELHTRAKTVNVIVEKLINASSSNFKLFLQTPNMIYLYRELTSKIQEFLSTTHDTVANNLDQIKPDLFTPMLLEADRWEDKLGLLPGTLSAPLKQITDEFLKGFLHAFELDAKTHVALVCDKQPLQKRMQVTRDQMQHASDRLNALEEDYEHLVAFYNKLQYATFAHSTAYLAPGLDYNQEEALLKEGQISAYKQALPKLTDLCKKTKIDIAGKLPSQELDQMLNATLTEEDPKHSNIAALVTAYYHQYLGKKATYEMRINTAKEKLAYLTELTCTQELADLQFIEEYTTESFEKQMDTLCNRHIGLQYTDKEYRKNLSEYILTFKAGIIEAAKTTEDINLTVKNLLKNKIRIFEREHFGRYYHLDTVRVALARFKNYFSLSNQAIKQQNAYFEDDDTLAKKTNTINLLSDIAENDQLTIEARLEQIILNVQDPNFERIILTQKKADYFSFTYLLQGLVWLLEALYLYTPTAQKLQNHLTEAVITKPEFSMLTNRFGLFAQPTPEVEAVPAMNNAPVI